MNLIDITVLAAELETQANDPRLVRRVAAVQSDFKQATGRSDITTGDATLSAFERGQRTILCRGFGQYVDYIYVTEAPLVSVDEIRYDPSGVFADDTIVDLSEFWWETNDCKFQIHWRNRFFCEGSGVARVTFTAGYPDAEALPADLVDGLCEEVIARYRRGSDEQFQNFSLPGAESFTRGKLGTTTQFDRIVRRYRAPLIG